MKDKKWGVGDPDLRGESLHTHSGPDQNKKATILENLENKELRMAIDRCGLHKPGKLIR